MSEQPLILVTNDDGVDYPGLRAATQAVLGLGEIMVVAPQRQYSAAGRSISGVGGQVQESAWSFTAEEGEVVKIPVFAIDSSPAQVVRYGVAFLAKRKPSLAISGINYGENLATAVTVSGTVGAALEAAAFGIPSLAVSLTMEKEHQFQPDRKIDFSATQAFTRRFARLMLSQQPLEGVDLLKIDIPIGATAGTPWRLTRLSRQRYIYPTPDGLGYEAWVDFKNLEPDSDIHALFVEKVVSVTPLTLDLTARVDFEKISSLLEL
ncbi:MAG: 5'/3'-nucleotidase SurE [Chloroflexi bacterium]|nr:5'/3'-nucleotidase SurE [Chloroflexota bacterium]